MGIRDDLWEKTEGKLKKNKKSDQRGEFQFTYKRHLALKKNEIVILTPFLGG